MNAVHELNATELAQVEGGFVDPFTLSALAGLAIGGAIVVGVIVYGQSK